MSRTVRVELGERGYDILIGQGVPVGGALAGASGVAALIVSDSNVAPLYGEWCAARLHDQGVASTLVEVPAGEASKGLSCVQTLYDKALAAGLDRAAVLVALGGGMVGDLTGFVAATYLRGIRLVQVPTTLLAMVDSSVGGKTAVNLPQGKNLVGAFHQPIEVAADLSVLATLPDREYRSGLAEMVKYGVIWDAPLFERIEREVESLLARDPACLEDVVARCCEIKADVVALDERDAGVRAILNFGHTLGHAVETVSGYGTWLHGEAVAIGMAYAARLSVTEKGLSGAECDRLIGLLERIGLPVRPGALSWEQVSSAMAADKKARAREPLFVLADRIGSVVFGHAVEASVLASAFEAVLDRKEACHVSGQ